MATEVSRQDFGATDKGHVIVIGKETLDDNGKPSTTYEVRHGVRTLDSGLSKSKAETLAKALGPVVAAPASEEVSEDDAKHRKAIAAKVLP